MQAAGALATDIAATSPPGIDLNPHAYLLSGTLFLLRAHGFPYKMKCKRKVHIMLYIHP